MHMEVIRKQPKAGFIASEACGTSVKMGAPVAGKTKADHNSYCGPAVISALTGCTTGEAAYLIRRYSGKKSVMGTYAHELFKVLRSFNIRGHDFGSLPKKDRPTLAAWLKATHGQRGGRTFLISAGHHWQLVSGNKFTCGKVKKVVGLKHEGVSRRARVAQVWEITMMPGKDKPLSPAKHGDLLDRKVEKKVKASARNAIAKLARQHGFTFEVDGDGYFDTSPFEGFPHGFHTRHYSMDETLDRLEFCLKNPDETDEAGYYSE